MNHRLKTLLFIALINFIFSCTQEESLNEIVITGAAQKGPYVTGAIITAQELTDQLIPNGESYQFAISDDFGSFSLFAGLSSNLLEMQVTGFYFNELSGQLVDERLTLTAMADVTSANTVNVNVLTTLANRRIKQLVNDGNSFEEAQNQAEREILSEFGLPVIEAHFSQLSITGPDEESSILLAVSVALQGDHSATQLSTLISQLSLDLEPDGSFDAGNKRLIQEAAAEIGYKSAVIRKNLEERYSELGGTGVVIPEIESYLVQMAGAPMANTYQVHEIPNSFLDESSAQKANMHYHPGTKKLLIFDFDKNQIIRYDPMENTYSTSDMAPWEDLPLGAEDVGAYANVTYLIGNRFYIRDFYLDLELNEWVEIRDPNTLETSPWFGSIPLREYQFTSETLVYGVRKDYDDERNVSLGFYSYNIDTKELIFLNSIGQLGSTSIEGYDFQQQPTIYYGIEYNKMLFSIPVSGDLTTYYLELNLTNGSLERVNASDTFTGRTSMRYRAAIAFNDQDQEVLIYGGHALGYAFSHQDVWGYRHESQEWVAYRNIGIEQLYAGDTFDYAYVPVMNSLFIFGGWNAGFLGERLVRVEFL